MTLSIHVRIARGSLLIDAAFEVAAGETFALLGPNGSGKSSIVACLAGLLAPAEGTISLDGRILDDVASGVHVPSEERSVGVAFQGGLLFPHLSALENTAFPLRARGLEKDRARERARELLIRVGFPAVRLGARPAGLSGGEAQRVVLARALIGEPRLLLLDEPTSALDVRARSEIRTLIRTILDGFDGFRILVTHDPVEAMTFADRIVVLEDGRMTQRGTPEQLRNAPRTPYVADLVGLNLFTGRLEPLEDGVGRIATGAGDVVVPWPGDTRREPIDDVLGVLRPADVALHITPPEGSARNVLHGPVAEIAVDGQRARVRLTSAPPLVAEVTLGSVGRMGIHEGDDVWASFKAVEVALVLP